MIKALNIATQGLLQAERRATDIAKEILDTSSRAASSFNVAVDTEAQNAGATAGNKTGAPVTPDVGFGNLIQQFSDLRAEEQAFKASAIAFKKIDETLGTLLDNES